MADNVGEWSSTAASNESLGAVSLLENVMTVKSVNNGFRELMAQVATGISANAFMAAYTAASASGAASIKFAEDTDNGTSVTTLQGAASLAGDITLTLPSEAGTFGVIIDEDDMASDSVTKVPTQQSVKAYVDDTVAAGSQAAFKAHRNGSNLTATTSGTAYALAPDTEVFDVGGYYDTSNGRFTPPAGRYLVGGSLYFTDFADQASLSLQIYKNGALDSYVAYGRASGTGGPIVIGTTIVEADGDDYFEFYGVQNTGGSRTIGGDAALTYVWAVKI